MVGANPHACTRYAPERQYPQPAWNTTVTRGLPESPGLRSGLRPFPYRPTLRPAPATPASPRPSECHFATWPDRARRRISRSELDLQGDFATPAALVACGMSHGRIPLQGLSATRHFSTQTRDTPGHRVALKRRPRHRAQYALYAQFFPPPSTPHPDRGRSKVQRRVLIGSRHWSGAGIPPARREWQKWIVANSVRLSTQVVWSWTWRRQKKGRPPPEPVCVCSNGKKGQIS